VALVAKAGGLVSDDNDEGQQRGWTMSTAREVAERIASRYAVAIGSIAQGSSIKLSRLNEMKATVRAYKKNVRARP
jgi:hypothetical protein